MTAESPPGKRRRPGHEFLRSLGPGLVSGAADDDPSGISTYSQAGARFGFGLLWTAVVTFPLMVAVQLMCARVGLVSRRGLASVLGEFYNPWVVWVAIVLLVVANTVNIAADLGGMAAGAALLTGWPPIVFVPVFAVFVVVVLVVASYMQMARFLKWATLTLFAYVFAAFAAHPHWPAVFRGTIAPHTAITGDYLLTFVAILGTTISPYLFFWQAAQEAEDEAHRPATSMAATLRGAFNDTAVGMGVSNLIMYFIILTTGATLYQAHAGAYINTAEQAAAALRPLAGDAAALLFTLGIVGTGLLGVPVLAGSAAYAVSEAARWRGGMDDKLNAAPRFYGVIALATVVGAALNYVRIDAMRMLFWSAVINGLLAPPLIILLLVVTNDKRVMGSYRNGLALNLWGGAAAVIMTIAAVALVWSWIH